LWTKYRAIPFYDGRQVGLPICLWPLFELYHEESNAISPAGEIANTACSGLQRNSGRSELAFQLGFHYGYRRSPLAEMRMRRETDAAVDWLEATNAEVCSLRAEFQRLRVIDARSNALCNPVEHPGLPILERRLLRITVGRTCAAPHGTGR
jgi:hypothetical protein